MKPEQSKPFSLIEEPYKYLVPIRVSAKATTSSADTFPVWMVLAGTFFFITTVLFISVLFATSCLPDDFLEVLQPVTKIKKPIRVNDNKDFITYIFVPPQGSEE